MQLVRCLQVVIGKVEIAVVRIISRENSVINVRMVSMLIHLARVSNQVDLLN